MKKNKKSKNYKKMKKNNIIKKQKSDLKQTLKQIIMGALFYSILFLIPIIIKFNSRITLTIVILVSFIIIFYNGELFLLLKKTNSYFNTDKGYKFLVILVLEVLIFMIGAFAILFRSKDIGLIEYFNSSTMMLIVLLLPAFQFLLVNIKNRIKNASKEKRSKKENFNLVVGSILGSTSLILLYLSLCNINNLDYYIKILVILNIMLNIYLFINEIKFDDN